MPSMKGVTRFIRLVMRLNIQIVDIDKGHVDSEVLRIIERDDTS